LHPRKKHYCFGSQTEKIVMFYNGAHGIFR
jgi:hypothetical protein